MRLLASRVADAGPDRILVVAASLDDRQDAERNLRNLLLIGGAVALVLASLAGYGAATAALRPVEEMRRRAQRITATEGERRLPLPPADDELRRLGETLNGMLGRLDEAIERERAFVDDASHELRTPLALHKTELELALRYAREPEEMRAALRSSIEEVDRLIALAEDMLIVARSGPRPELATATVEIGPLLERLRERFAAQAEGEGRSITVAGVARRGAGGHRDRGGHRPRADQPDRQRARPRRGADRAAQRGRARGVELHVLDSGPGFDEEFLPRAFDRFTRADPARGGSGAGLGLSIVATIARGHGGSFGARNRPEGGADAWITLPAAP